MGGLLEKFALRARRAQAVQTPHSRWWTSGGELNSLSGLKLLRKTQLQPPSVPRVAVFCRRAIQSRAAYLGDLLNAQCVRETVVITTRLMLTRVVQLAAVVSKLLPGTLS